MNSGSGNASRAASGGQSAGRIARLEGMLDRLGDRLGRVDAAIDQLGGAAEMRERFARRADEIVEQVEHAVANLGAIEADVVDVDPGPVPAPVPARAAEEVTGVSSTALSPLAGSSWARVVLLMIGLGATVLLLRRRR